MALLEERTATRVVDELERPDVLVVLVHAELDVGVGAALLRQGAGGRLREHRLPSVLVDEEVPLAAVRLLGRAAATPSAETDVVERGEQLPDELVGGQLEAGIGLRAGIEV